MLPRAGGVLDQPGNEMMYLSAIMEAFNNVEELEGRRDSARNRMKQKGGA